MAEELDMLNSATLLPLRANPFLGPALSLLSDEGEDTAN